MPDKLISCLMPTGVGTLPHQDTPTALDLVFQQLTHGIPYWPQLPKRAPLEDMNLQFAGALHPLVKARPESRGMEAFSGFSREEALAAFYERLFSGDIGDFGLKQDEAVGMFAFMERLRGLPPDDFPWIKGQVTGPVSLGSSVLGPDGKALLYDDEVAEALARGLGAAGAAQVEQMAPLGRKVLLFVDEPSLASYGSAFTPISRERVIELLSYTFEEIRSRANAVIGAHCCGNTDWSILVDAGVDVINLDAFGYGQNLLLYPPGGEGATGPGRMRGLGRGAHPELSGQ